MNGNRTIQNAAHRPAPRAVLPPGPLGRPGSGPLRREPPEFNKMNAFLRPTLPLATVLFYKTQPIALELFNKLTKQPIKTMHPLTNQIKPILRENFKFRVLSGVLGANPAKSNLPNSTIAFDYSPANA